MNPFNTPSPSNISRQNTPSRYKGYKLPYQPHTHRSKMRQDMTQQLTDYGPYPFAANIEKVTKSNTHFRTALWTGNHLQLTLMSLLPGEDIGLEIHPGLDQFIRVEDGKGLLLMGDNPDNPNFQQTVYDNYAFIVPSNTWHNLINVGTTPLKLYSIYAPPQHPFGTVQETKADAMAAEAASEQHRLKK